ncbi:MAG TPA: RagB/SusD family nutrient uptake outer membrane protein [Balneolaceae bacterium]|nr:RagB/SusD family nutrient uptake outer membrane protein [Balneolaceae bacterium]
MNKIYNKFLLIIGVAVLFSACDAGILNLDPKGEFPEASVWEDPNLMEAFLNDIYLGMGHGLNEVMLSSLADESHFIHGYGVNEVVMSTHNASNRAALGNGRFSYMDWGPLYSRIRQVNTFLTNAVDAEFDNDAQRDRMLGEAHFLRAYFYHNLMRSFGGVPIITTVYGLEDDFNAPRNTFAETIDFIVQEADRAAELLPITPPSVGRATMGAALALKSRVLLYAASDLYNESPENDLVGYTSGDRRARWQAAKDAAQDLIDSGIYSLYDRHEDPTENYTQIFLTNDDHEEAIMSRFFLESRDDGYNPGLHNGPNGYRNWAGNTPIQQLVDDYEMVDGNEFDWGNPEHASAPYENRDPRFYATILYDGAQWRPRPTEGAEIEPHGIIQTFERLTLPNGDTRAGLDTRNGPIEDWNGGYSRYYLRKFIDPNVNHSSSEKQEVPWRFFRYAEVLLNYAEASIELGDDEDARRELNKIRARAGMPDIQDSGEALKERYRNERRVELAFEEHRYFDIRRWKIAPEVMVNAQGIEIMVEATDYRDRDTYFNYQYNIIPNINQRGWNDRSYFTPIDINEMRRNDSLRQNPGYGGN